MIRKKTREVNIGNVKIGSNNRIALQSMLKKKSSDIFGNISQALDLQKAGCDIIRVAVPTFKDIKLIQKLKNKIKVPIVADIHFDYKIAIECVNLGVDKVRINPCNISDLGHIKKIIDVCKKKEIPIRLGFNTGSIKNKNINDALNVVYKNIEIFEGFNFNNFVISLKSSNVQECVYAYKEISKKYDYPLHIGITETGLEKIGTIKSAIGIGALLLQGIGDTVRVSLSDDPLKEIETSILILKSLGLYHNNNVEIISCPTCGRATIDVINLSKIIEKLTKKIDKNVKIAIMGCPVNGPGESTSADIGISGAEGFGFIFKKGKFVKKIPKDKLIEALIEEIEKI